MEPKSAFERGSVTIMAHPPRADAYLSMAACASLFAPFKRPTQGHYCQLCRSQFVPASHPQHRFRSGSARSTGQSLRSLTSWIPFESPLTLASIESFRVFDASGGVEKGESAFHALSSSCLPGGLVVDNLRPESVQQIGVTNLRPESVQQTASFCLPRRGDDVDQIATESVQQTPKTLLRGAL